MYQVPRSPPGRGSTRNLTALVAGHLQQPKSLSPHLHRSRLTLGAGGGGARELFFFFSPFEDKLVLQEVFLAALDLRGCARAFSSCGERGLLFVAVCVLLTAVASHVVEHGL